MNTPKSHWFDLPVALIVNIFAIGLVVITCLLLFCGCAVIRLSAESPDGKKAHGTLYAVDWPWRDLKQVANRANITVKTNAASISFKGEQDNPINTNALNTVNHLLNTTDAILQKVP